MKGTEKSRNQQKYIFRGLEDEWEKACAPFRQVKWVKKGGRRLKINK